MTDPRQLFTTAPSAETAAALFLQLKGQGANSFKICQLDEDEDSWALLVRFPGCRCPEVDDAPIEVEDEPDALEQMGYRARE